MALESFGLPFWLDLERPRFRQLEQNLTAEAVVIGSGIAGLKIARRLGLAGVDTVVLESGRIGDGASSRNQGSINHGPNMTYAGCIDRHSRDVARALWSLGLENHRMIREQIDEYEIDCDYQVDGMTSLARTDFPGWEDLVSAYKSDADLLLEDGFDVTFLDETAACEAGGNPVYAAGLRYNTDAQFHSGKYVLGLACGIARSSPVALFEAARVQSIETEGRNPLVKTDRFNIRTQRVFLSTNALIPQFVSQLAGAMRAERGQVLVSEPLDTRPCRGSFGTRMAWWREIIEPDGRFRLLFGGGRERDEPDSLFPQFVDGQPNTSLETDGFSPSPAHQARLDTQLALLFPHLANTRVTHRWGGLQSFTADDCPEAGLLDESRQIYGMGGFCGRGNCHSDVMADYVVSSALGTRTELSVEQCALIESLAAAHRASAVW